MRALSTMVYNGRWALFGPHFSVPLFFFPTLVNSITTKVLYFEEVVCSISPPNWACHILLTTHFGSYPLLYNTFDLDKNCSKYGRPKFWRFCKAHCTGTT
jgi:hypothetical protein